MVSSSFMQTDFRGGEWSPLAQGRMADPAYKTGNNVMQNALPLEAGAWGRRSGLRYLAHTRGGTDAALLAFDFVTSQPYQMELTDGYIRFFAGLSLLTWLSVEGPLYVSRVFSENPARIALASLVPSGWADGDTVVFRLPSVPATCVDLLGRQFVIANLDTGAQTFTLKDAITGGDVDGTGFVYTPAPAGSPADTVERVFELVSAYPAATHINVNAVRDDNNVLLIHKNIRPYLLTSAHNNIAPFEINTQDFEDGPYLDINDGIVTMSLSGTSGSVTVTASGTSNVNHGQGFLTTDVGRLIRFQGGPASWDIGATYAKEDVVLGSDNNIYTSIAGDNTGNDPTTDNLAEFWEISPTTVTWTWLKITAWTSTTVVTATIMGDEPAQAAATKNWRLGLYCDTLGWPAVGCYHDGRLWLSGRGAGFTNRVDGSKSNDPFNFSPSDTDGTVADDNAVAAIFRANENNIILWMLSTEDGLILGTPSGEWRIKASALDDPISDVSIQARRISTYGCADMLPVQPGGETVFVQRQGRRVLAHQQVSASRYTATNVTRTADHITESGLVEIAYQQEPLLCIWGRRDDGTLVGGTYQHRMAQEQESFAGWHEHIIGNPDKPRTVGSIQSGPAYDGLSDAIYMVTNQPRSGQPDHAIHWVQAMMPLFDTTIEDWGAYFTDGGSTPPYAQLFQIANGDDFDGITIYGLWALNGQSVAPVIGGLDLGDRLVTDGSLDVPFGSDPDGLFTLAFFTGLSDGTDYDVFSVNAGYVESGVPTIPSVAANTLLAYVGDDSVVMGNGGAQAILLAPNGQSVYQMSIGSTTPGMRKFDAGSGNEVAQTARDMVATTSYAHDNGFIYASAPAGGNTSPIEEIETATASFGAGNSHGSSSSSLAGSGPGHFQLMDGAIIGFSMTDTDGDNHDYIVFTGLRAAQQINEVTLVEVNGDAQWVQMTPILSPNQNSEQLQLTQDKTLASLCNGRVYGSWAWWCASEQPYPGTWATDGSEYCAVYLFQFDLTNTTLIRTPCFLALPVVIDPTWTNMTNFVGLAFDEADECVMFFVETDDAVTNTAYLVKIDPWTSEIIWQIPWDDHINLFASAQEMAATKVNGKMVFVRTVSGNYNAYIVDTIAGTLTKQAINTGFSILADRIYDRLSGSITFYGGFSPPGTGPTMQYIGAYLPANGDTLSGQWGRFYLGTTYLSDAAITTYTVPISLGHAYKSRGQLLRPDYGPDAGARNGPAFGKLRRIHWYGLELERSQKVSIGTEFDKLNPVKLLQPNRTPYVCPTLFSGIASDTIQCDYSFDGQIAWEITRPYPCTISAIGGYIEVQDK